MPRKTDPVGLVIEIDGARNCVEYPMVQLEYLVATVQGKLRSGRACPFVKVEGCCD
jgi:hypothetical protein